MDFKLPKYRVPCGGEAGWKGMGLSGPKVSLPGIPGLCDVLWRPPGMIYRLPYSLTMLYSLDLRESSSLRHLNRDVGCAPVFSGKSWSLLPVQSLRLLILRHVRAGRQLYRDRSAARGRGHVSTMWSSQPLRGKIEDRFSLHVEYRPNQYFIWLILFLTARPVV